MHPARPVRPCLPFVWNPGWVDEHPRGQDAATLLEEFIHYTNIARTDLASGYAEQLLNTASGTDLAFVVDSLSSTVIGWTPHCSAAGWFAGSHRG